MRDREGKFKRIKWVARIQIPSLQTSLTGGRENWGAYNGHSNVSLLPVQENSYSRWLSSHPGVASTCLCQTQVTATSSMYK